MEAPLDISLMASLANSQAMQWGLRLLNSRGTRTRMHASRAAANERTVNQRLHDRLEQTAAALSESVSLQHGDRQALYELKDIVSALQRQVELAEEEKHLQAKKHVEELSQAEGAWKAEKAELMGQVSQQAQSMGEYVQMLRASEDKLRELVHERDMLLQEARATCEGKQEALRDKEAALHELSQQKQTFQALSGVTERLEEQLLAVEQGECRLLEESTHKLEQEARRSESMYIKLQERDAEVCELNANISTLQIELRTAHECQRKAMVKADEQQKSIDRLAAERHALTGQLEQVQTENGQLRDSLSKTVAQASAAATVVDRHEEHIAELQVLKDTQDARITELQQLAELQISGLNAQLEVSQTELMSARAELESSGLQSAQHKLGELGDSMAPLVALCEEQVDKLSEQNRLNKQQAEQLLTQATQMTELKAQLESKCAEVERLSLVELENSSAMQQQTAQLVKSSSQIRELSELTDALQVEESAWNTERTTLLNNLHHLTKEYDNQSSKLDEATKDKLAMEHTVTQQQGQISEQATMLEINKTEIRRLQQQIEALTAELEESHEHGKAAVLAREETLTQSGMATAHLKQEVQEVSLQLEPLTLLCEQQVEKLSQLVAQNSELKEQLAQELHTVGQLQAENNSKSTALSALMQEKENLQGSVMKSNIQLDEQAAHLTEQASLMASLKSELETQTANIASLLHDKENLEDHVKSLSRQVEEQAVQINLAKVLEQQLKEVDTQLELTKEALIREQTSGAAVAKQAQHEISQLNANFHELSEECKKQAESAAILQEKNMASEQQLIALQKEHKSALESHTSVVSVLKATHDDAIKRLNSTVTEQQSLIDTQKQDLQQMKQYEQQVMVLEKELRVQQEVCAQEQRTVSRQAGKIEALLSQQEKHHAAQKASEEAIDTAQTKTQKLQTELAQVCHEHEILLMQSSSLKSVADSCADELRLSQRECQDLLDKQNVLRDQNTSLAITADSTQLELARAQEERKELLFQNSSLAVLATSKDEEAHAAKRRSQLLSDHAQLTHEVVRVVSPGRPSRLSIQRAERSGLLNDKERALASLARQFEDDHMTQEVVRAGSPGHVSPGRPSRVGSRWLRSKVDDVLNERIGEGRASPTRGERALGKRAQALSDKVSSILSWV